MGARRGDLLEIEYTGRLQDGKVFDGSNIKVSPLAPDPWPFMPTFYCHRDVCNRIHPLLSSQRERKPQDDVAPGAKLSFTHLMRHDRPLVMSFR